MNADLRALEALEPRFYRAPSAHNTQPWVLDYTADRARLRFDPARELPVGDPTRRDLLLSLGAFVEAVLVVAADAGLAVAFEPAVDLARHRVGSFVPASALYETSFGAGDLERRRTSRLPYEPGPLDDGALDDVRTALGRGAGLHVLEPSAIVDLYAAGDRRVYDSPAVVRELRGWLRLSPRHPRFAQDGLSYPCLGLPRPVAAVLALVLSPGVYRLVRALRLHRLLTAATKGAVASGGSVLVLTSGARAETDVLEDGRRLLRVWLALARRGLHTHPLSQILDDPGALEELSARVGARPFAVFRAGRSEPPARSARLR